MKTAELKIRKGTFKHIESELFAYHDTKREINQIKQDIIKGTASFENIGGGRSNIPGDPTGMTATLIVTHRKIEQLEKIVSAIESVHERLSREKQMLIRLKYWTKPQPLTWEGIAQQIHISRRQALNWRDEIVFAISKEIGWR